MQKLIVGKLSTTLLFLSWVATPIVGSITLLTNQRSVPIDRAIEIGLLEQVMECISFFTGLGGW